MDSLTEQHRYQRGNRADPGHDKVEFPGIRQDLDKVQRAAILGSSRPVQCQFAQLVHGLVGPRKPQCHRRQLRGQPGGIVFHDQECMRVTRPPRLSASRAPSEAAAQGRRRSQE